MSDRQAGLTLGFLTVLQDAAGISGGYLVTNAWGRPPEFRLTTPVQPNRVQEILYGAALKDYLHCDLIGQSLVEKSSEKPTLIVTDSRDMLPLATRVGVPVVAVVNGDVAEVISHARSKLPLVMDAAAREAIEAILANVDSAVELSEPFSRIRGAMGEARRPGAMSRAA